MEFGIGVITVGNRNLNSGYTALLSQSTHIYIHFDYTRQGPAHGRNECIHLLYEAGCDYIALFDDDCYPIKPDWQDFVVRNMEKYSVNYLQLWDYRNHKKRRSSELITVEPIGCFSVLTRKTVETVGYYNSKYKGYGWEDVGYSRRARNSGVNGIFESVSFQSLPDYICAEDIEGGEDADGFANLTYAEKQADILKNRPVVLEENKGPIYIPYNRA